MVPPPSIKLATWVTFYEPFFLFWWTLLHNKREYKVCILTAMNICIEYTILRFVKEYPCLFFLHCGVKLKSTQTILAKTLWPTLKQLPIWTWTKKVPQAIWASIYCPPTPHPPPNMQCPVGIAHLKRPSLAEISIFHLYLPEQLYTYILDSLSEWFMLFQFRAI